MHYCIHLFTKEIPSESEIDKILEPFNEEKFYEEDYDKTDKEHPPFLWDWYQIGGRYCGRLELKMGENMERYEWGYYKFNSPREGRLFHSTLLRKIREKFKKWESHEEDYYNYLGDGTFIRVDGAYISDLANTEELSCYGFVGVDGTAHVCEYWDGETFKDNPDFNTEYATELFNNKDGFLTVLDIHN